MATELEIVEQNMLAEVAPFEVTSRELLAEAQGASIATDADLKTANEIKKRINAHSKLVKEKRLEITRPINNVVDMVIGREKEILAPLEEGKAVLATAILAYEEEQERLRQIEAERVGQLVGDIEALYKPGMTETQVNTGRTAAKNIIASLAEADRELPAIKLALMTLSNRFTERINDIEVERQRAQKQKLEDDEAKLEREKRELQARKDRQELEKAQLEADKAEAKAERERPKSNIAEITEFEITNPDEVPRHFCSPDERLIRAAIKDGRVSEGPYPWGRVFKTKKVR